MCGHTAPHENHRSTRLLTPANGKGEGRRQICFAEQITARFISRLL